MIGLFPSREIRSEFSTLQQHVRFHAGIQHVSACSDAKIQMKSFLGAIVRDQNDLALLVGDQVGIGVHQARVECFAGGAIARRKVEPDHITNVGFEESLGRTGNAAGKQELGTEQVEQLRTRVHGGSSAAEGYCCRRSDGLRRLFSRDGGNDDDR